MHGEGLDGGLHSTSGEVADITRKKGTGVKQGRYRHARRR